jgi:hypothetical protein
MTDGDNTENRWRNNNNNNGKIDERTKLVCANIKKKDIQIYTIRLVSGNASLLRGCATREDMYFDVKDAAQLSSVFRAVASQIASLHLSK